MRSMTELQILFLENLGEIQKEVVNIMLCNLNKYNKTEDILLDVTYEIIIKIMELFDGYYKRDLKLDIVNKDTFQSITEGIQLHDKCVDFLECTNI